MLSIYILGLCLLAKNGGGAGRTVVLPDISTSVTVMTPRGATCVEPHVAYIEVSYKDVFKCPDCFRHGDKEELDLLGDTVTIAGIAGPYSEKPGYETFVPHMKDFCPGFRLLIPPTASTVKITSGVLQPLNPDSNVRESLVVVDKIAGEHIVITATRGAVTRTLDLWPTTERIDIANRYTNHIKPNTPALAENHWLAFYTLAKTPVVCDLPNVGSGVETTSACSNSGYP